MDLSSLYLDHPFWIWMSLAAILLAVEVLTNSGYLLWAAASAGATALITGFKLGLPIELVVFAALTIATSVAAKRYLPKPLAPTGPDINDTSGNLIGRRAQTSSPFAGGLGRVQIDGKDWAAELEGGDELPEGAPVKVVRVLSGARLKVKAG